MEWLIGGFVVWLIYRILTRDARRHRYFMQAMTWKTGGLLGTGARDIHKSVSLFNKASDLGHAQASFELGAIYESGWSHPTSSNPRDQVASDMGLALNYFSICRTQSPDMYTQLDTERTRMKEDSAAYLRSIMEEADNNR
jgi:TPR repeat protein